MPNRITFVFTALLAILTFPVGAADMSKTKTISYRGGVVTFSIPASWQEEYEPAGGGTFYEDNPDSGTLRLSVLSFSSNNEPAQIMALSAFPEGSYELLQDGHPLRYEVKETNERGEKLHLHTWSVAVAVPPHSMRLALFHHTVLAGQEGDPLISQELAFLHKSIRSAVFSTAPGVAGNYTK
jgi:hypothetical protein